MDILSELSFSSLQTLDDVIEKDRQRYIRKGYGLIFACLITILFMTLAPIAMKYIVASVQEYSVFQIYLLILLPSSHLSYILANAYMWVIYSIKLPFFERYKIDDTLWPWEKNPEDWAKKRKQVFKNWLINSSMGIVLTVISAKYNQEFRIDLHTYPLISELVWQLAACMITEDTAFYFLHRLLHHPRIYGRIHKQHHEFYKTVSFASEYCHPVEFLLSNIIPTMLGPALFGSNMHIATLAIWLLVRVFETVDGHSGYEFSWSPYRLLPFSGSSEYHNFHHSHNVGNYSSFFYYWDSLLGTNKDFFNHLGVEVLTVNRVQVIRQELTVISNGSKLAVSFFQVIPYSQNCIIYCHGYNGCRVEGVRYAHVAAQYSLNFCSFDFQACGHSEGEYITFGQKEQHNITAVIDALMHQFRVTQFILWGRSLGATTIQLKKQRAVVGYVLDSCFTDLNKLAVSLISKQTSLPKWMAKSLLYLMKSKVEDTGRFKFDDIKIKVDSQVPTLFICSNSDTLIKSKNTVKLYMEHKGNRKMIQVDGDHNECRSIDLIHEICQWAYHQLQTRYPLQISLGHDTNRNYSSNPAKQLKDQMTEGMRTRRPIFY